MADVAIERFTVDVTSDGQTYTLSNDVGSLSNAFVRVNTSSDKTFGRTNTTGNVGPNTTCAGVLLTDTNELTFFLQATSPVKVMGEVWRYTGSVGGDYEFVSRQRGSVSFASGDTLQSQALSGLTNRDNVIPFYNGYVDSESNRNIFGRAVMSCHVDASDNIVFERGNSGSTHTSYYDAVEFIGSGWNVGHGVSSAHDTGNSFASGGETVTLNTSSTGLGGSTFDVGDWATAMIIEGTMEGDTSEDGLSDCIMYFFPSTTTSVRCTLDNSNSRNDGTSYVHVLQADDLIVGRGSNGNVIEGNGTFGTSISVSGISDPTTPLSELSLEWFPGTNGEGTAHARGRLMGRLADNSGYEIQHFVQRQGNTCKATYGVADVSELVSAAAFNTYWAYQSNVLV